MIFACLAVYTSGSRQAPSSGQLCRRRCPQPGRRRRVYLEHSVLHHVKQGVGLLNLLLASVFRRLATRPSVVTEHGPCCHRNLRVKLKVQVLLMRLPHLTCCFPCTCTLSLVGLHYVSKSKKSNHQFVSVQYRGGGWLPPETG